MADFILGVTGSVLAAPEIALAFAQCGKLLAERVQSFRNAPKIVEDLKRFGWDLYGGTLKLNVELAERALKEENLDTSFKARLEDLLERLRDGLRSADAILQKLSNQDGDVNKTYFLFSGERKLKRVVQELQRWQNDFWGLISLIDMKLRTLPDKILLTDASFKTIERHDGQYCSPVEDAPDIWLGCAEIADGTIRKTSVVIERKGGIHPITIPELKGAASDLARHLVKDSPNRGILRCLGYRETPRLELIFEVPQGLADPQTLRSLIAADADKGYGGGRPLNHRLVLAHQISEAVLSVRTAHLVHKNIRPENLLIFRREPENLTALSTSGGSPIPSAADSDALGLPFLTDWSMLRKETALSSRRGEADWLRDIYRHPQRQGLQPEERYNMGHDIYSLGVCLLEIGLWDPFIVVEDGRHRFSAAYERMAFRLGCVRREEPAWESTLKKPNVVQQVMVGLAKNELPPRTGTVYADLVVDCLTCLEGGFGDPEHLEDPVTAGMRFSDSILGVLCTISI